MSQGLLLKRDGGVEAACGDPGQVECGGAEHPDAVDAGGEADGGASLGLVLAGGSGPGGVVADRDDGVLQPVGGAGRHAAVARVRAWPSAAWNRSAMNGASITPRTGRPSRSRASEVAHSGMPWA